MYFPVKRVENRTDNHTIKQKYGTAGGEQKYGTAGRKQKYGTGDSASISNSGDVYENCTAKQTTRTQTKT